MRRFEKTRRKGRRRRGRGPVDGGVPACPPCPRRHGGSVVRIGERGFQRRFHPPDGSVGVACRGRLGSGRRPARRDDVLTCRQGIRARRIGNAAHEEGQATVEAAMLLPTLMVCLALLVQPACLLYTRAVMQAAAIEGCRLAATPPVTGNIADQAYRAYILRRLAAVPDAALFHEGGEEGWDIRVEPACDGAESHVVIQTKARPLPFVGALASLMGVTDGGGSVILKVEASTWARPTWVEGNYDDWSSIW